MSEIEHQNELIGATYRPISRKYREEQQARERANTLRQQNEQKNTLTRT
ncbi:hypothetical protein ACT7C1_12990 [Bacillus paranthracis]